MPHRPVRAAIIGTATGKEPGGPDAGIASVIGGDPMQDIIIGGPARVEELDADEEASGGDGVDLVVDALLGVEEGEAQRPVRRHGVGGQDGGRQGVGVADVVVGAGELSEAVAGGEVAGREGEEAVAADVEGGVGVFADLPVEGGGRGEGGVLVADAVAVVERVGDEGGGAREEDLVAGGPGAEEAGRVDAHGVGGVVGVGLDAGRFEDAVSGGGGEGGGVPGEAEAGLGAGVEVGLIAEAGAGAKGGCVHEVGGVDVAGFVSQVNAAFDVVEVAELRDELSAVVAWADWLGGVG
jgi:hypothetical protein